MATLKENMAQEQAVHEINGPVIIISCPGSGKTTTLIRRIHEMVINGIDPKTILMVTFATSAADDMRARYASLYGSNPGITFATIHSVCFQILRMELNYTVDDIYRERDQREFFLNRLRNAPWVNDAWDMSTSLLTDMTVMRNNDIPLDEYTPKSCEKHYFTDLYRKYEEDKRENGLLDFDDMLVICRDLLRSDKEVLKRWQNIFRYIQCDEYQDTNKVQRDVLYLLAGEKANLCVVGDDDQSIYRFRGARSDIMMQFPEDFKDRDVKVIYMSTNYRSAQKVVDIADVCIRRNTKRFEKEFISDRGSSGEMGYVNYSSHKSRLLEMQEIVKTIRARREKGIPYKDMAILFRTNKQAQAPVQMLSDEGIPFDSTEMVRSIYDGWIFADIKAYIELSMGTNTQRNLMKVLNRPERFLKQAMFRDIPFDTQSMLDALDYIPDEEGGWKKTAAEKTILRLMNCFGPGKVRGDMPASKIFEKLAKKTGVGYQDYIKKSAEFRNQDPQDLMEEYAALEHEAGECGTVDQWLRHAQAVSARVRSDNQKRDENGVKIATMHKSKGMEWDTVFLIDVNENIVPHRDCVSQEEIEEERRLLYVGMTRAKNNLYISCSGKESPFMKQTIADLKEKYAPTIRKKFAGSPVEHFHYGRGKIVSYTDDRVTINFDDYGIKKFKFPDVFRSGKVKYV